ncbi:MAG: hypothetical protein OEW52_00305 [Thermoleophilia bacterium]|nr:hypothetical protein [Thermoleophilia bacterium]
MSDDNNDNKGGDMSGGLGVPRGLDDAAVGGTATSVATPSARRSSRRGRASRTTGRAATLARSILNAEPDARGEPCDVVLQAQRAVELATLLERAPEVVLDGGYGAIPTPAPDFYDLARAEELRANGKHRLFMSLHEAYAVILEEVDELWELVRRKASDRDPLDVLEELVQIAAMAGKAARSAGVLEEGGDDA